MSEEVSIPLLRELIQRGADAPEPSLPQSLNDSDQPTALEITEYDDEIEQEFHAALQQIQAEQQEIAFDEIEAATAEQTGQSSKPIEPELAIDVEIRNILDRHMAEAQQEIIELIKRKTP